MIPRETIDRIYAAAKIEEVVGEQVTLRRRGANLLGLCPFHTEKTGSFTVSPSKGIYKCFGCGAAGNAINFVMQIENCTYAEALRTLAQKYHIPIEERELTTEEKQAEDDRAAMFVVNEWANQWFQDQLWNTDEGRAVGLSYFIERGLTEVTIRKFQLGYSPEKGNPMSVAAKQKGFSEKYLIVDQEHIDKRKLQFGTGLCGKSERDGRLYDRFRDRVIYPIHTISGKTVAFAGRILRKKYDKEGKEIPQGKYVNSPDSYIYSKKEQLYGFYQAKQAISKEDKCYLVEGQMDVISMSQAGIENVVASGGTALTQPQIRLIHRFTDHVTLLYDGDSAGVHAALRGIDMLLKDGLSVKVMLFPDGDDPDSFARKHTSEELRAYINAHEEDFIAYKIRVMLADVHNDPIKRAEVVKSVIQSLSVISDRVIRDVYVQTSAKQLNISEKTLVNELYKIWNSAKSTDTPSPQEEMQNEPSAPTTSTPVVSTSAASEEASTPELKPAPKPLTPEVQAAQRMALVRKNIQDLVRIVVRYGERKLYTYDDGYSICVGMYIIEQLRTSQIAIDEPEYQRLLNEFEQHYQDPGFVAETYFSRMVADPELTSLATQLLWDKYELSRLYGYVKRTFTPNPDGDNPIETEEFVMPSDADHLADLVEKILTEVRSNYVDYQLPLLMAEIVKAVNAGDEERIQMLMEQQQRFNQFRKDMGRHQGRAVVRLKS